jgi:hypothetical protein
LKALFVAIVATPILYGLGAEVIEASGLRATYIDGRFVLGLSFFTAFSVARLLVPK